MSAVLQPSSGRGKRPSSPILPSPAAANAAAASFAALTARLDYLDPAEVDQVRKAYRFADEAHLGQIRASGEPYITHPIAVAAQCAEWKLDVQALMAALLHDAIEDCGVTKPELIERFRRPAVAELVDGLTKLDKLQFNTREENQAESFRKMLLAMARDVRVILVKLADRSHNMRTLEDVPREKWNRIASETLDIYAPIAHRLGLNATYRELQELSFRYLRPWRYAILSKAVSRARSRRRDLIQKVQRDCRGQDFESERHEAGYLRSPNKKTLYSICKVDEKHLSFARVADIGFRVVDADGAGVIPARPWACCTSWRPADALEVQGTHRHPKINGYQSLHTTLVGPVEARERRIPAAHKAMHLRGRIRGGRALAVQGRRSLQEETPSGSAPSWPGPLLDIQNEIARRRRVPQDHVKIDLFPDAGLRLHAQEPDPGAARWRDLPWWTSRYALIHSDVGDHTVAARINGAQVPHGAPSEERRRGRES